MLVDPLQPERKPSAIRFHEPDPELGELREDAAHREVVDGLHRADRMRDRMLAEPGIEPIDHDRNLARRLTTAVRADRETMLLGGSPDRIEHGIV